MAAPTVYNNVAEGMELEGQLFAGKSFWVAQRVPSRLRLLDDIKANGGEIVLLEKMADYLIADHFRKGCPPGSISYEFVDKSIKAGEMQDPENHRAGPPLGEAREAGAVDRAVKGSRAAYTAEEDRTLYKWVCDAETAGGLVSGNEIYKKLEAKCPRHTWQSWRDRYLKHLRGRPPSAFNLHDKAPPTPPSDQSHERTHSTMSASKPSKSQTPDPELHQPARRASGQGKARAKEEYTLEELAGMFKSDDWEELYAFVDIIDDLTDPEQYDASWTQWAEHQGKQPAEQWRQYYEKVVRPQWLRDPEWKRKEVKKKVEERHEETSAGQSQTSPSQQAKSDRAQPEAVPILEEPKDEASEPSKNEHENFEQLLLAKRDHSMPAAYTYYAREKKSALWQAQPSLDYTGLHRILIAQWHLLSDEERALYLALTKAEKKRAQVEVTQIITEVKLLSSSIAQHKSPRRLSEMYKTAMKRIREHNVVEEVTEHEERHTKRRRSESATLIENEVIEQIDITDSANQPLEVSSTTTSSVISELDAEERRLADIIEAKQISISDPDEEFFDPDNATESIESDDLRAINCIAPLKHDEVESEEDFPQNSPTPRATRRQKSNFDTQAILSSPSQDILSRLPQQQAPMYSQRSSSPTRQPESDASTTLSLQEFRRSLNDDDDSKSQVTYPPLPPQSELRFSSPASSTVSSASPDDPDPPLEAEEFEDFFQEQHAEGFANDFIVKALKRTRFRPMLTVQVLEAWREGKPLPNERGIWSIEDDDAVESGDGVALAKLERKHTTDGWGGITERLVFLDAQRG